MPLRLMLPMALWSLIGLASTQAQTPADPDPGAPPALSAPQTVQTPPTPAPTWVPGRVAELQALDKVNARHSTLNVKVGDIGNFGSLQIAVQACMTRPPDQAQDSAAFLSITDTKGDGVAFKGWMVASQPALSMLQHPVFDIRVTGCRP
jgi:hypothetical protein